MFSELKINGTLLPRPDEALTIKSDKKKQEFETEAGTTQVSVTRTSQLTITGTWTISGKWIEQFREWANDDTVTVSCYFPSKTELTEHECQLTIDSEKHIRYARDHLKVNGLYEISVTMEEL